jgi:hypothetical protein
MNFIENAVHFPITHHANANSRLCGKVEILIQ